MGLSIGIVGLPNVGKSTLFNALTKAQNAEAANYPFCTIEPNKAIVPVPDNRMNKLPNWLIRQDWYTGPLNFLISQDWLRVQVKAKVLATSS